MKKVFWWVYNALLFFVFVLVVFFAPLRILRKKFSNSQFLSLWAGTPIIAMVFKARAERLLGIKTKSLVYNTYYITDDFDINLSLFSTLKVFRFLMPIPVFIWACVFTDRLHFYCDRGLFPSPSPFTFNFLELYVYKFLGIQVFFWTYGADIRSRDTTKKLGEPNCCTECTLIGKACICDEKERIKKIEALKKHSTALFSMGDMIEYTPDSRNDLFFWPVDLYGPNARKYEPAYPKTDKEKPLRIVHASNHRMFKGTHFIIDAVENLKAKSVFIELILVEKMPNEKALDVYRSADIIFDQCLIGFHGYFALEGMAMGKPVMCFIRKPDEYLLHHEECPIINVNLKTLESSLHWFAENRYELKDIGKKSRQYIEKYFTLDAFAGRLNETYKELGILL